MIGENSDDPTGEDPRAGDDPGASRADQAGTPTVKDTSTFEANPGSPRIPSVSVEAENVFADPVSDTTLERLLDHPVPSERWKPFVVLRNLLTETRIARRDRARAILEEDEAHLAAYDVRLAFEGHLLREDEKKQRRASFPLCLTGAVVLAVIDALPAWWASQALGGGTIETALVTALFVSALAGFAALMSTFHHSENDRGFAIAAVFATLLVVMETGLRTQYLIVVNDASLGDWLPDVAILGLVTGGLLWVSYAILLRAESVATWGLRVTVKRHDASARRASAFRKRQEEQHHKTYTALSHVWRSQVEMHPELLKAIVGELQHQDVEAEVAKRKASRGPNT